MKSFTLVSVVMLLAMCIPVVAATTPTHNDLAALQSTSDGGPINTCQPGKPCDPIAMRLTASDGGPINTCQPGKPCDPVAMRLMASDGGPINTCQPGKPCDPVMSSLFKELRSDSDFDLMVHHIA